MRAPSFGTAIGRPRQTHRSWRTALESPLQVCKRCRLSPVETSRQGEMASSAVEATVESCAAEASALGFTCTWHDRSTGAPAADAGPRAALTLRLTHESAEDAVHVDFLPVLDRVQIFGACGARRARCDVAAGAPGAGRRFAVHVLQPLVTGAVADETLLGLPESVRRVIYELLPAPAVGLVAEAAKPLRDEATSDAVWMRLLRRDAEALLVDPRDLPTADRMRRARDMYAAFVQFRKSRRNVMRIIGRDTTAGEGEETARPRLHVYEEDPSRWGLLNGEPVVQGTWRRFTEDRGLDWALSGEHYYSAAESRFGPFPDSPPIIRLRGPTW